MENVERNVVTWRTVAEERVLNYGLRLLMSVDAFGPNLRRARMMRGVSLAELSARTNVSVELWEALERNDFSRWPAGIYARAYIREYAVAVGADPAATVDEFCRSFPQGDRRAGRVMREHAQLVGHHPEWADEALPPGAEGDRRAGAGQAPRPGALASLSTRDLRMLAGICDVAVILVAGLALAALLKVRAAWTLALVALLYHGVSVAVAGCSPAVWLFLAYVSSRPRQDSAGEAQLFPRLRRSTDEA